MIARSLRQTLRSLISLDSVRLSALGLAALALSAAPARAQVKISQVYNLGGVTSNQSQRSTDYVELYNPGPGPVALAGWAVQLATSSTAATWTVNAIPGAPVLGVGQYFLVAFTTNTTVLAPGLPTPDASFPTINIADTTSMKIALTTNTVALAAADPVGGAISDFVGFGTGANGREPNGAGSAAVNNAPAPSGTVAIFRRNCGGQDTNNNANDWANGAPSPRNMATALSSGSTGIGLAFPQLLEEAQTTSLRFMPASCVGGALSTTAVVTVDLSSMPPLLAGTAMSDAGILGDDLSGDGVYMLDVTIPVGTPPGSYNFPVSIVDGPNSGGAYIALVVNPTTAPNNDNCSTALAVAVPSSTAGTVLGATVESNPVVTTVLASATGMSNRRGVWYQTTGTGNTMTASLCGTLPVFDSVMIVMCGRCDALSVVGNNDDFCASLNASQVTWCSTFGQTYWIWLSHFNAGPQTNTFTLNVSDDGAPCCGAVACTTCPASIPMGSIPENEADLGIAINDGCPPTLSSTTPYFTDIAAPGAIPTIVRGKSRGFVGNRDFDFYRFQAPVTGGTFVASTLNQSSCQLQFFSLTGGLGVCPQTTVTNSFINTRCGVTALSATLTPGTWYTLGILTTGSQGGQDGIPPTPVFGGSVPSGGSDNYSISMTIVSGGGAFNNSCTTPNFLGNNVLYTTGTTVGATNDGISPCDAVGRDLWYRFAMPCFTVTPCSPAPTLSIDTCGSAIDTVVTVYDGSCAGPVLACNDDCGGTPCAGPGSCLTVPGVLPGQILMVRVSDKGLGVGGAFQVRAVAVPANDFCSGAISVICPSSCASTTVGASLDAGLPVCTGPGFQNFTVTAPGIWFKINVPASQTIYADTLIGYDSKITVFSGTCGLLTCVTVNDDIISTFRSKVGWQAIGGVDYYILVHGFSTSVGAFTLNVTCDPTPPNDLCSSATVIGGTSGSTGGTNVGATGDGSGLTAQGLATCATNYTFFDTWFSYTAPCTGQFTFNTCGTFDTILSVHTACPTFSVSNQLVPTASSCNDQGVPSGCSPGSFVTVNLTSGLTYLIRVATAGAASVAPGGGLPYTLTWAVGDTDGDGTNDCADGCPLDPLKIAPGQCGCGIPDTDTDGDGTANCNDGCPLDPLKIAPGQCGCGIPDTDTDGDGTANCNDGCPLDPLKIAPGQCGCGIPDTDTDGDGTANCNDGCPLDPLKIAPGQCGCGIPDTDTDGDGTADCNDGCPFDPLKTDPGFCGCGVPDVDTDGDGTLDCVDGCPLDPLKTAPGICGCGNPDVDSDLDGLLDCQDNCPNLANPAQADFDSDGIGDGCDNCERLPNPGQEDCNNDGIGDVCAIVAGAPDCNLNGVPDTCDIAGGTSFDLNANTIPDECEQDGGSPFCFGSSGCPCGNNSAPSEQAGCKNATPFGGKLVGVGNTSVSNDTLSLQFSHLTGQIAVIFQSQAITQVPFSDGLKCVSGPLIRIGTGKPVVNGEVSYPTGSQPLVSVKGLLPPTGGVRYYQGVYRSNGGPCGTGLNISNGLSVVWAP